MLHDLMYDVDDEDDVHQYKDDPIDLVEFQLSSEC